MNKRTEILNFIDNTSYLYTDYICNHLKQDYSLQLIEKILVDSDKEISEAVLVLVSTIKYLFKDKDPFGKLEASDLFQAFLYKHEETILNTAKNKKVQGNIPQRAFPIIDLVNGKIGNTNVKVIELGASYGLIGLSLLNMKKIIENQDKYFYKEQRFPSINDSIISYLGIEYDPPDKEWLLASNWNQETELRLKNFLSDIEIDNKFNVVKGNAFGFSKSEPVKKFVHQKNGKLIVLTSFMLYQFSPTQVNELKNEIYEFIEKYDGHWINQYVDVSLRDDNHQYFIEWDGEKQIELEDDSCLNWRVLT